jgi:hypothetical protein
MKWQATRCGHQLPQLISAANFFFSGVCIGFLLGGPTLIIAGWCIYRPSFPITEFLEVMGPTLMFGWGLQAAYSIDRTEGAMAAGLITCIGFVWFVKTSLTYQVVLFRLIEQFDEGNPFMIRLRLVREYCTSFICLLVVVALAYMLLIALDVWGIFISLLERVVMLGITCLDFYMFSMRKEFEGVVEDHEVVDDDGKGPLIAQSLISPISTEIVFVKGTDTTDIPVQDIVC